MNRRTWQMRFWERVLLPNESGCMIWSGGRTKGGYGRLSIGGRYHYAHRLSFQLNVGPIPEGMQIDHLCHTPPCVRPDHLRLATPKQNNENLSGAYKNSRSGIRGVSWAPRPGKWRASVGHLGRVIHVGYFTNPEDAEGAVIQARRRIFTHSQEAS